MPTPQPNTPQAQSQHQTTTKTSVVPT